MIALLAISCASSAVTMRSHWFALSSTVMSSGLAMGLLSQTLERAHARKLRVSAGSGTARVGTSRELRLGNERALPRMRRRLLGLREDAGLLEQRQHVRRRPALDDLAVGDAHEVA